MISSQDFIFFFLIRMKLCLPIVFSSLFLIFIDHGQAMAVNHSHLLCCLCRVIFHSHQPEFPRNQPSSCTWFLGMQPQFVRCPLMWDNAQGVRFLFSELHFHGPCWQTTSIRSSLSRNPEWLSQGQCSLWRRLSLQAPGSASGRVMDKAGRFHPPAVSHCLVLVLSSLPW